MLPPHGLSEFPTNVLFISTEFFFLNYYQYLEILERFDGELIENKIIPNFISGEVVGICRLG